jgi:hypothetical protein
MTNITQNYQLSYVCHTNDMTFFTNIPLIFGVLFLGKSTQNFPGDEKFRPGNLSY